MEEKDLKDFALPDKFKDVDVKTSLEELENFDFTSDEPIKLDEFYEMTDLLKSSQKSQINPKDTKETIQAREAENVIKKEGERFLGKEVVEKYQKEIDNLNAFLRKYEVNTDTVKNMSESDKNKLYGIAGFLFDGFQKIHNNLIFIFPFTLDEFKFTLEVIIKKLEYDRDGNFQVKELKDKYLNRYLRFIKDQDGNLMTTMIDINSLMILYHHITRYVVKGAQNEHECFVSMVTKMEERLMLYNAYKIITDRLSDQFLVWGGALTIDEVGLKVNEDTPTSETTLKVVDEVTGQEKKN